MVSNFFYILLLVFNCFVSAFAQVLLKKSTKKSYEGFFRQYLNLRVIAGYALFFLAVLLNTYVLKFLSVILMSTIAESLVLVLSFINGKIFFGENISREKIWGGIIITIGIIVLITE